VEGGGGGTGWGVGCGVGAGCTCFTLRLDDNGFCAANDELAKRAKVTTRNPNLRRTTDIKDPNSLCIVYLFERAKSPAYLQYCSTCDPQRNGEKRLRFGPRYDYPEAPAPERAAATNNAVIQSKRSSRSAKKALSIKVRLSLGVFALW